MEEFPQWFIDLIREAQEIRYGRIPVEFVIADGRIAKVIGSKSKQVKFRQDNEAKIYAVDQMNSGPVDGTITFSIVKKGGKITQVNSFDNIEHHYPV